MCLNTFFLENKVNVVVCNTFLHTHPVPLSSSLAFFLKIMWMDKSVLCVYIYVCICFWGVVYKKEMLLLHWTQRRCPLLFPHIIVEFFFTWPDILDNCVIVRAKRHRNQNKRHCDNPDRQIEAIPHQSQIPMMCH